MSAPAKRRLSKVIAIIVLGLFGFLSVLLSATPQRAAAINTSSTLNFQARLLNSAGGVVPDGLYNIRFKIYDGGTQGAGAGTGQANSGTGGTYLWTESHYDTNGVTAGNDFRLNVINGYFNVNLGSQTAFSGINWDQELWMTMDIGGTTQTASPTYDGEMTNSNARIKLTGVPYAFSAGQIAKTSGSNRGTLSFNTVANNPNITLPDETGTVCTTAATGVCTVAGTGFVQLQSSTPGTAQTGNLNITGTAIVSTLLQSANLDAASSGALGIGNQGTATSVSICNSSNCNTVSIATNTDADTINIGDGLDTVGINGTTVTITGKSSGSAETLVVNNSTSTGNIVAFKDNGSAVLTIADGGNITATGTYNTNTFTGTALTFGGASGLVSSSSGGLTIQAASGTVTLGTSTDLTAAAGLTISSGGSSDLTLNSVSGTLKTGSSTSAILFTNSGTASIDATSGQNLSLGTSASNHTTTLGSTSGTSTTQINAGSGGLKISTPSSVTSNSLALCRDSSTSIITACDSGAGGKPFIQGGNSFGATAVLGTNDSNSLTFETNNTTQATIAVGGATSFKNSADSVNAFSVQTTASANLLSVNTSEGYVINNGIVTPGNIVENPSFEATGSSDATGWYTPGANQAITVSAANARSGNNELQITGNSSTHAVSTKYFAVRPGDTIYTEAYVKNSGGANGDAGTYLEFTDKDKGSATYSNNDTGVPGTSYVANSITTTVPASKFYVRLVASVRATATTGTFYFDDFYLKKVNEQAPLLISNVSSTAFQVQNATGATILGVDSTNSKIFSTIADGASAVGFIFNTPSYTTSGAKLISAQNNGSEKFYVDKDGNVSIASGAQYKVNGTQISSANLSNDSDIAKLSGTGPQTFTGNNKFTGTILSQLASATAFQVQNATDSVFTVDTSANKIILGKASALTGTIQFQGSGGNGTLTLVGPTTPNAGNFTLSLPAIAANDTVCTNTTQATACTNYAPSTGGSYLSKTSADTASIAAAGGNVYAFTNSSSAASGSVLSLDNGNNTGSTLKVTTSGNPATGALIFASNTNASAAGNLIDLQSGSSPTSKFSVNAAGNLITAGTINTNTVSSTALTFSGASPVIGASTTDTGVTLQANGVGALLLNTSGAGTVNVGTSNSTAVNIGSGSTTTSIEGSNAGTIAIGNSTSAHTINIGAGGTSSQVVSIGSNSGASSITQRVGTGNFSLDGASNSTYTLGSSTTTGTFTVGGSSQTGTITLGQYNGTSSSTINIGAALNAAGTQAVNIATGTTGTGNTTVGNTGGGTTLIQSPTTTISGTTINLNAATIATNQATVALLQGATALNVGATTGTFTIRNANTTLGNAAGSGVLTNNGATLNTTLAVLNDSDGGALGGTPGSPLTAGQSVDIYTSISIAQTTAGQTITLPTPTASTSYGRLLYISNIGTTGFIIGSGTIAQGTTATLVWSDTSGGASWQYAGADVPAINNQNSADQTGNFRISGTGRANTRFTSPFFDSISGALGIGDTAATAITVGNTTNTSSILLQGGAAATYTIGNTNTT
ncbi:hypothetical protein KW803_01735, partial [Candidatus Saccharibacteria bacterium]|nr:hypothetical protein [Candidatus Saccharibacteria bacterium]